MLRKDMERMFPMILVTGATGLSRSLVIREFARQQAPVRALVRNRAHAHAFEAFGVHPTTFAEFARRNAAVFRDESASS